MNVLITGGTGFIGYHLSNFHANKGDNVVIFDNLFKINRNQDKHIKELFKRENVVFCDVDLSSKIEVDLPFEIDIVYHLAAINGTKLFYTIPYELCKNNILATINLFDFLEGQDIKKIVYSSSSEVYAGAEKYGLLNIPTAENAPVVFPQPTDVRYSYGTSKFISEFLSLNFGRTVQIATSVIRYHNIYGPRMGVNHAIPAIITRLMKEENPFKVYGAHETRAFCYIDDAVEATFRVAESVKCNDEIIHIGNPSEEIRIDNLTRLIAKLLKKDGINFIDQEGLSASVSRRCPDISKLKDFTGFYNSTSLEEGISKTIDWYKENYDK